MTTDSEPTCSTADDFLWRRGDPWRDLTPDVMSVGVATIVTKNRTSRLVDVTAGWQQRIPLNPGNEMYADFERQPLERLVITPCGCYSTSHTRWHATTGLLALLAGHHPNWAATATAEALATRYRESSAVPGHPAEPCHVPYCEKTSRAEWVAGGLPW